MNKTKTIFFVLILTPILLLSQNWELKILDVNTITFPKVTVPFIVFEDKARMINDIKQNNIVLMEDGNTINNFQLTKTKSDFELRLVVLLDVSGSMRNYFEEAKLAFRELLNIMKGKDQCALITFGSKVTQISGFTKDFDFLSNALNKVELSSNTRLFDGLVDATKLFSPYEKTRNIIILITDGKDDGSIYNDVKIPIDKAKRNKVEIFSIGIGNKADLYTLEKLSESTGAGYHGKIYPLELRFVLKNIYNLMKSNYLISFNSPDSIIIKTPIERSFVLRINYENKTNTQSINFIAPVYNPNKYLLYYLVSGITIVLLLIIIFLFIYRNKKKRKNQMDFGEVNTSESERNVNWVDESWEDSNKNLNFNNDDDDENWENDFDKNIEEEKTIIIRSGKLATDKSLGYLVMRSKKYGMNIYEIQQRELIIGRGASSDILLEDEEVSKLNTKVRIVDDIFFIDDLGSSNGTFVNDKEMFHAELKDGDVIRIATHEFVFKCIEK